MFVRPRYTTKMGCRHGYIDRDWHSTWLVTLVVLIRTDQLDLAGTIRVAPHVIQAIQ